MLIALLIAILVFTGVIFFVARSDKGGDVRERVRRLTPQDASMEVDPLEATLTLEEEPSALVHLFERILNALGVPIQEFKEKNALRFQQAGLVSPNAPIIYLFCKYVLSGVLMLVAVLLFLTPVHGIQKLLCIVLGLLCGAGGVMGPDIYLKNATQKRQKKLERSFPDSLDLLLVCVESGLALDGALARVCRELGRAHPDITQELNRTRMELTLLNNRTQALQNLADRTGLLAFRSLVGTLMQSEKFGTNLTETLRVLAEDYRMQRLMAAENKAGRLPTLMTIPLICFMMPAFFMIIMGPAIISLLEITKNRH